MKDSSSSVGVTGLESQVSFIMNSSRRCPSSSARMCERLVTVQKSHVKTFLTHFIPISCYYRYKCLKPALTVQPCDSLVCFYYFVDSEEEDIYDYTHKFIVGFWSFYGI